MRRRLQWGKLLAAVCMQDNAVTVLSSQSIRKLCVEGWLDHNGVRRYMIQPFHERTVQDGKTFGLGPAGYDVRLDVGYWLFPFFGRLSGTYERFDIPRNITFCVMDKSSWARKFVQHMNTNGEPGWRGWLTLEAMRFLPWPMKLKSRTPIVNIMFLWLDEETDMPYPDDGKYQDQRRGPVSAIEDGQCHTKDGRFSRMAVRFISSLVAAMFTLLLQIPSASLSWFACFTRKPVDWYRTLRGKPTSRK